MCEGPPFNTRLVAQSLLTVWRVLREPLPHVICKKSQWFQTDKNLSQRRYKVKQEELRRKMVLSIKCLSVSGDKTQLLNLLDILSTAIRFFKKDKN